MELMEAYGEVTYELEPEGQTEKKEIMRLQTVRNGAEGESSDLITESLRYISERKASRGGNSRGFSSLRSDRAGCLCRS